jgi:secreted trypsin-like serine protease
MTTFMKNKQKFAELKSFGSSLLLGSFSRRDFSVGLVSVGLISFGFLGVGCVQKTQVSETQTNGRGSQKANSCSAGPSAGPSDDLGIIGGTRVSEKHPLSPSVVFLRTRILNAEGEQFDIRCTGTLISERVVLTAAHCVAFGTNIIKLETQIVLGQDPGCSESGNAAQAVRTAEKTISHPQFSHKKPELAHDFALIRLNQAFPKAQARFLGVERTRHQLRSAMKYYAAGFGVSKDLSETDETPPYLRTARLQIREASDANKSETSKLIEMDQSSGDSACSGDSGGPLIAKMGSEIRVVGVASFVFAKKRGQGQCLGFVSYGRIDGDSKWLRDQFRLQNPSDKNPF